MSAEIIESLEASGKHGVIVFWTNKRAKYLPKTCQNCIHCKCKPGTHSKRAYEPWPDEYVCAPKACDECNKLFDTLYHRAQEKYSFGCR